MRPPFVSASGVLKEQNCTARADRHFNARPAAHKNAPHQNSVTQLLPYCTLGAPLTDAQVIALSDTVGNLKELTLLALSALSGDQESVQKLAAAVGYDTAMNIAHFFGDEYELEG